MKHPIPLIMKPRMFLFLTILLVAMSQSFSQSLSAEEQKLYELLMEYRQQNGLPPIPLSRSLSRVAQVHVRDLAAHRPDMGDCNAHSWSAEGAWTPCCYTPDHAESPCMWRKPAELTSYTGNGYEIACGSNDCCADFVMTADYALYSWQGSPGHNSVILNQGNWGRSEWNAIGIGIYRGFAAVWFGKQPDAN